MPDHKPDISFLREIDPSGRLTNLFQSMIDVDNNIGRQTLAAPVGKADPPPTISGINVVGGGGFHRVTIQDNNPIPRGVEYHLEWDTSPQFTNPQQISLGPDRGRDVQLGIGGPVYWRAYSSKRTSEPSEPVYFGTKSNPTGVTGGSLSTAVTVTVTGITAGAGTATGTGTATTPVVGPARLPSTGAGTEPSQFPQGGAGFGFNDSRTTPPAPDGVTVGARDEIQ